MRMMPCVPFPPDGEPPFLYDPPPPEPYPVPFDPDKLLVPAADEAPEPKKELPPCPEKAPPKFPLHPPPLPPVIFKSPFVPVPPEVAVEDPAPPLPPEPVIVVEETVNVVFPPELPVVELEPDPPAPIP